MWAVVALKSPEKAKSRLGAVLSAAQRRALFFALAGRVIEALEDTPEISRVAVVTASDEVESFARGLRADVIREASDRGTAQAFAVAVKQLRPLKLDRLLMIAGDLPLVSTYALCQLLNAAHNANGAPGIVLAPDRQRIGTNALLCTPPDAIAPCFGAASFRRHLAAADAAGLPARVVEINELAFDLDVAADLEQLRARIDISTWLDLPLREALLPHPRCASANA